MRLAVAPKINTLWSLSWRVACRFAFADQILSEIQRSEIHSQSKWNAQIIRPS